MRGPTLSSLRFRQRGMLILAMSLWAFAAALQGISPLLSEFLPENRSATLTEVEASAIHLHRGLRDGHHRVATCAHHPEGCPARCQCPKTGFVGEHSAVSARDGRLTNGLAWVECAEARAAVSPAFSIYLPESIHEIVVTVSSGWMASSPAARPRVPALAPPAKIPIG